jgi:hypothetical protein
MNDFLKRVENYDAQVPTGRFGFAGFRWAFWLIIDFFFEFSQKKDADGFIMRKDENPTYIGRKFRSLYKSCIKKLESQNPVFPETLELPSIDAKDFDKEFFQFWRKKINMPLRVKGFLEGAPILKDASIEELVKTRGSVEVQSVKLETRAILGQNVHQTKSTLEEFLTSKKFENYYVNNFYGVIEDEDFQKKCKGEEIDKIQNQKHILPQWFISRTSRVGSSLHCAGGDNMFLNIIGQKEWHFIHPTYSPVLQVSVSKYAIYSVSEMKEAVIKNARHELVEGYPHMERVPIYKSVLEPGDILFNPPFWWHSVRNLTNYNVGCATRYWSNVVNSIPINFCMFLDVLKHPKNSAIVTVIKMLRGRQSKKTLFDSIFSKN